MQNTFIENDFHLLWLATPPNYHSPVATMRLSDQDVGFIGMVQSISNNSKSVKAKLFSLGVLPNTEIQIIRKAPLGDPLQIRVRGSDFAISKSIADQIVVKQ